MEKKISIVLPVYNKGLFLRKCIDSILCQTYNNVEIVAVDNGSTDNSLQILQEYASKDDRIKLIALNPGRGLPNGHNVGLDNITGDYFTIIDADDYIDADYIEKLYKPIEKYGSKIDMVLGVNDIVYEDGRRKYKPRPELKNILIEGKDIDKLPSQLLDELNTQYYGFPMPELGAEWIKLVKSSIIKEKNIRYNPELHIWVDWIFNLEILKYVKSFVYTTEPEYHFFQSYNSVSREICFNKERIIKILKAIEAAYDMVLSFPNYKTILNAFGIFYSQRIKNVCDLLIVNKNCYPDNYLEDISKEIIKLINRINSEDSTEYTHFDTNDLNFLEAIKTGEIKGFIEKKYRHFLIKKFLRGIIPSFVVKKIKRFRKSFK